MRSILQRIPKYVSGVAHARKTFAPVRGRRFDAAPMNRHPGVRHFVTGVLIGTAVMVVVFGLV